LKTVGELQRQVVELQGRLQASASQLSTAVDTSVVVDYKHALALKEKEIEGLRSKRAHELEEREQALEQGKRLHQELERQKEESARQKEESAALLSDLGGEFGVDTRAIEIKSGLSIANDLQQVCGVRYQEKADLEVVVCSCQRECGAASISRVGVCALAQQQTNDSQISM
jgi:hypothetical protein